MLSMVNSLVLGAGAEMAGGGDAEAATFSEANEVGLDKFTLLVGCDLYEESNPGSKRFNVLAKH